MGGYDATEFLTSGAGNRLNRSSAVRHKPYGHLVDPFNNYIVDEVGAETKCIKSDIRRFGNKVFGDLVPLV